MIAIPETDELVTLAGKLAILPGSRSIPPQMELAVYCPWCRRHHHHGWGDDPRLGTVEHRHAHCTDRYAGKRRERVDSPFHESGYLIACEPLHERHNVAVYREYIGRLLRWELAQAQRGPAGGPATSPLAN